MLRKTRTLAAMVFMLSIFPAMAANAMALVEDFATKEVSGQAYVLADVTGDGNMELVIGSGQNVYVLMKENDQYQVRQKVGNLSSGVCSLAVGDVDNDTWPDLLIGTGQAGAIRIFGWDGEKFVRKGETDYLWSPVCTILVIDIDGDGWKDVLAVTESGAAQVLRWDGLRYRRAWEHNTSAGRIKFFQTADLNGDGVDELVYALAEGKVVVAQWNGNELATVWENYPWGTVSTVSLVDLDGDHSVEIIVTTEQQMLYSYGWTKNGITLKRSFFDAAVKFSEALGADIDGDGKGELVTIDHQGIKVWKIAADKLQLMAQATFVESPREMRLTPNGDRLTLLDREGTLHSLRIVDDTYFRVLVGNEEVALEQQPIWVNGMPLLAAQDVAELLGLNLYWDAEQGRLTAIRDGIYAILAAGDASMRYLDVTIPLSTDPVVKDGKCYVPLELIRIFATSVAWHEASRTLQVIP